MWLGREFILEGTALDHHSFTCQCKSLDPVINEGDTTVLDSYSCVIAEGFDQN